LVSVLLTHSEFKWTKVFCFFFSKKKRLLSYGRYVTGGVVAAPSGRLLIELIGELMLCVVK
jgi:hypothetical protein